jgi:hypothetical protein
MTERGQAGLDGAPACPFVAFGDDRDGRSTTPDHRHRCFAETPPAPRAVAHQEAYCLSSAFPVCPTFQDWARREAAHARGAGERPQTAPTATVASAATPPPMPAPVPTPAEPDLDADWAVPPAAIAGGTPAAPIDDPDDEPIQRNPPRDWAAPPPWASGQAGAGGAGRPVAATTGMAAASAGTGSPDLPPRPVEGQGLAGSPADRVAAGEAPAATAWSASVAGSAHQAPDEELASLVGGGSGSAPANAAAIASVSSAAASSPPTGESTGDAYPPPTRTGKRPAVSSTRPSADAIPGPAWERMRHYETYPPIKTRSGMRGAPRVALVAGALGIAALALFMLPALIGIGGGGSSASASPSATRPVSTASAAPTIAPGPSQLTYTIKKGDTLSKVANKFHVDLADLLAANPDIKDPNKVSLGQVIIIPTAGAGSPAATAKASGSAAP